MDALIRFCFKDINPETIQDMDQYTKIYSQAKWIWDHITVSSAAKALNSL